MSTAQVSMGASPLLKDDQKKCTEQGSEVLGSTQYTISRALCEDRWTLWLAKGADADSATVIDKLTLPPLVKSEKLDDSHYCYFKGNRENRLVFYGIFDLKQKGTVKSGQGKLVKAYIPDTKKEKLVSLTTETINKVICESEADGE